MVESEIKFMEYFERVMLPNRRRINVGHLQECEKILGRNLQISGCSTCLHRVAVDLMNLYNRMKPSWLEYQKKVEEEKIPTPQEFMTQYEVEVVEIDEVLPESLPIVEESEEPTIVIRPFEGKNVWKKKK